VISHGTIRFFASDLLFVTMRLFCTVMEIWHVKDNGVMTFNFLVTVVVIGQNTRKSRGNEFTAKLTGTG